MRRWPRWAPGRGGNNPGQTTFCHRLLIASPLLPEWRAGSTIFIAVIDFARRFRMSR